LFGNVIISVVLAMVLF